MVRDTGDHYPVGKDRIRGDCSTLGRLPMQRKLPRYQALMSSWTAAWSVTVTWPMASIRSALVRPAGWWPGGALSISMMRRGRTGMTDGTHSNDIRSAGWGRCYRRLLVLLGKRQILPVVQTVQIRADRYAVFFCGLNNIFFCFPCSDSIIRISRQQIQNAGKNTRLIVLIFTEHITVPRINHVSCFDDRIGNIVCAGHLNLSRTLLNLHSAIIAGVWILTGTSAMRACHSSAR